MVYNKTIPIFNSRTTIIYTEDAFVERTNIHHTKGAVSCGLKGAIRLLK